MTSDGKVVLTYGTFDLLHRGHVNLLRRAKALAGPNGKLYVGVSSDAFNAKKGKQCIYTAQDRKYVVNAIKYVDGVFDEECWEQKVDDIIRFNADMIVMGSDWADRDEFKPLAGFTDLYFLPRTENISSTTVKKHVQDKTQVSLDKE